MTDPRLRQRRGDERLLLTCLIVERMCAPHVAASERLEAAIAPAEAKSIVIPLAQRLGATSSHGAENAAMPVPSAA